MDDIGYYGLLAVNDEMEVMTPQSQPLTIDATGLVVAPGFIDLHTHSPTPLGQYYQAFDGVTTALELEAGFYPVRDYGADISGAPLIHYGASAGHVMARLLEKNGLSCLTCHQAHGPAEGQGTPVGAGALPEGDATNVGSALMSRGFTSHSAIGHVRIRFQSVFVSSARDTELW